MMGIIIESCFLHGFMYGLNEEDLRSNVCDVKNVKCAVSFNCRGVTWVSAFGGCQQYLPNKIKFYPTKRGVDSSSAQVFASPRYHRQVLYSTSFLAD